MKPKKLFKSIIKSTPSKLRAPIIRRMYKYKFQDADDFEFALAETFEEKIAASKIVQGSYVQTGLSASEAELRVSQYSLLPSTYVFVAKHKTSGEIIATMSIILKTSVGLPIEDYVPIDYYIGDGKRAGELSAFSVKKDFRSHSNGLSIILMFYTTMYAYRVLGCQHLFISVRQTVEYFYKDLFFFKAIGKPVNYSNVNNVRCVPMYMHLPEGLIKMKRAYNHRNLKKNIYKQLILFPWKNQCDFTSTRFSLVSRFYYQPNEISDLISSKNLSLEKVSNEQKKALEAIYFNKIFEMDTESNISNISVRKAPRYLTHQYAIGRMDNKTFQLEIQEVSITGLMVRHRKSFDVGSSLHLTLNINDDKVFISTVVVWQSGRLIGLKILNEDANQQWSEMLKNFDSYVNQQLEQEVRDADMVSEN